MKKQVALLMTAVMVLGSALTGCSGSASAGSSQTGSSAASPSAASSEVSSAAASKSNKQITIGFVPMTLNNEYFITMINGAKEKAQELGVKLDVQAADQHASAAAQLQIVENMITSGVQALCIVPSSSEGLATALKKAKAANVSVINIDTKLDASVLKEADAEVPFYGTDNYAGAKLAGEYVAKNFPNGTKVAILTGIAGQQNAKDRRNGFFDAAKDKIKLVAEQTANWEVDQGYSVTQNILNANPDISFIFSSNDNMAIGALRAIQGAKKDGKVQIIGFDGTSEALNQVKSGKMLATVAQDPAKMGMLGVENAVKLVNGEKVEMNIDTGATLITKDNVDKQIGYSKKYSGK